MSTLKSKRRMHECPLVSCIIFQSFLYGEKKNLGVEFSDENITKWDLGLVKKCHTAVGTQMFWGELQRGYLKGSKSRARVT